MQPAALSAPGYNMDFLLSIIAQWKSIIAVLVVLGGLIFFHELGHFSVARLFGIGVRTFSLGFGPKLLTRRWGKTDYCLSLVPLGGYVSLVGEEQDPEQEPEEDPEPGLFTEQEEFFRRPAWQRLLVVLAGPVSNFVLAFLICWGVFWGVGEMYRLPVIGNVSADSPAAAAGIRPGDRVLSVDGKDIGLWEDLPKAIGEAGGRPVRLTLLRTEGKGANKHETEVGVQVTPQAAILEIAPGDTREVWLIGVEDGRVFGSTPLNGFEALSAGLGKTWQMITFTLDALVKLVQRVIPLDSMGGPIYIAQSIGQQAQQNLTGVLLLAALISVNLGILNLLPIPVLDGGHIVFFALEMLFGRPVKASIRAVSIRVGMALLLLLMVFATWNDLRRLFS